MINTSANMDSHVTDIVFKYIWKSSRKNKSSEE